MKQIILAVVSGLAFLVSLGTILLALASGNLGSAMMLAFCAIMLIWVFCSSIAKYIKSKKENSK